MIFGMQIRGVATLKYQINEYTRLCIKYLGKYLRVRAPPPELGRSVNPIQTKLCNYGGDDAWTGW